MLYLFFSCRRSVALGDNVRGIFFRLVAAGRGFPLPPSPFPAIVVRSFVPSLSSCPSQCWPHFFALLETCTRPAPCRFPPRNRTCFFFLFFSHVSAPSPKVALSDSAAAALAAWRGGSTPAASGGVGSAASGSKKKLSAAQGNNLTKYWGTPLSSQKPLSTSGKVEARGGGSGSRGGGGGRGDYVRANGGSGSGAASVPEVSREEAFDPMCENQDRKVMDRTRICV